jgi:hypothetical protein
MSDMDDWDDDDESRSEPRECSISCSHFDSLNQCCWLVSEHGLCRNRREGDACLYGFMEDGDE